MKTRHRIFLLLLAVSVPIAAALAFTAERLLLHDVERRMRERLRADLRLVTLLVGDAAEWGEGLDARADAYGRALGLRVTFIDPAGAVRGDSSLDAAALAQLENHSHRPEVIEAARAGRGEAVRFSTSTAERMLYMAAPVKAGGRLLGFARLAVPEREISGTVREQRGTVTGAFAAALAVLAGVGHLAARRLARPFEQVAALAEAAPKGPSTTGLEGAATEEALRLAAAIRRMRDELVASLAQATGERERLQSILSGMREGILVLSADRRVLLANQALTDILRLPGPPDAGRPLEEVSRDPRLLDAFQRCLATQETVSETVTVGGVAGRTYQVRVQPFQPAGTAGRGVIGILFDVTQMQALESVRRDFIVNVSHELRTPLTAIRAFTETLEGGAIDDPQHNREFLGIIRRHCDRMQALINDLTDLSLIETGAAALELEDVRLEDAVREALLTLRPRAETVQVRLEPAMQNGLRVRADPRRLEQILLNLIENGIKFNHPGGSVRVETSGKPGGVQIVISDTGIGIPSDHLEKVFHRFHRVDASRSREQGGTGLGLAIVKHLVRLHGGTIEAQSELGRGSRFVLELPAA